MGEKGSLDDEARRKLPKGYRYVGAAGDIGGLPAALNDAGGAAAIYQNGQWVSLDGSMLTAPPPDASGHAIG